MITNVTTPTVELPTPLTHDHAPALRSLHYLTAIPGRNVPNPVDLAWFLALPSTTRVRVKPKALDRAETRLHKSDYAQAISIADLFLPAGSRPGHAPKRRADIKWDSPLVPYPLPHSNHQPQPVRVLLLPCPYPTSTLPSRPTNSLIPLAMKTMTCHCHLPPRFLPR